MSVFFRVLSFVSSFRFLLIGAIALNLVYSFMSAASIALIQPILQAIFTPETVLQSAETQVIEPGFFAQFKAQFYGTVLHMVRDDDKTATLVRLAILIFTVFVVKNIFKYLGNNANTRLGEGIIKHIRDLVFRRVMHLSMDFFNRNRSGDLISLIANDIAVMSGTIGPVIMTLFRQPIEIVFFLAILLSFSPYLTLVALSVSAVSILVIRFSSGALKKYARRMQTSMADFTTVLQESIAGVRQVKLLSAEETVVRRFEQRTKDYVRSAIKNQKVMDLIPAFNELFAIVALCIVLVLGGIEVYSGRMASHEIMTFLFALFGLMGPAASLTSIPSQVQRGIVAAERVFHIIDQPPSVRDGTVPAPRDFTVLTLRNVSFSYTPERPILHNVSIDIRKGTKVAVVGSSGSGKSTLIDLVARLYDPQEGAVEIDGTDIRDFTLQSYRSLFGVVSQEAFLFNDTIEANIAIESNNSGPEMVREAARMANADTFIRATADGYKTLVGDRGILLSGGQRQRVSIARALVRKPPILLFDEATSALDSQSEKLVQQTLDDAMRGATAIIVAHRLSTIVNSDVIVVLDHGRIVESGSHRDLLERDGLYKQLFQSQFSSSV